MNYLSYYACGTPYPSVRQDGPESIYAFSPQRTGSVTFKLSGMTSDHDLYVLEDACAAASPITSRIDLASCIRGPALLAMPR